jgi:hypothetical protein
MLAIARVCADSSRFRYQRENVEVGGQVEPRIRADTAEAARRCRGCERRILERHDDPDRLPGLLRDGRDARRRPHIQHRLLDDLAWSAIDRAGGGSGGGDGDEEGGEKREASHRRRS